MSFYVHHYYLTAHDPDYFSADVYNVSAAKIRNATKLRTV